MAFWAEPAAASLKE